MIKIHTVVLWVLIILSFGYTYISSDRNIDLKVAEIKQLQSNLKYLQIKVKKIEKEIEEENPHTELEQLRRWVLDLNKRTEKLEGKKE